MKHAFDRFYQHHFYDKQIKRQKNNFFFFVVVVKSQQSWWSSIFSHYFEATNYSLKLKPLSSTQFPNGMREQWDKGAMRQGCNGTGAYGNSLPTCMVTYIDFGTAAPVSRSQLATSAAIRTLWWTPRTNHRLCHAGRKQRNGYHKSVRSE